MTADAGAGERELRADARRNRGRIIAAAKKMFADRGPDVPLEEVAREAAVGIGTLYRRFPDREALIREVARDSFEHVLLQARAAAEEAPSAWDALVRTLRSSSELKLSVRLALLSPLARDTIRGDPKARTFRRELLDTLDGVVRRAQVEGTLRADVGTGDVAGLLSLLLRPVPSAPGGEGTLLAERAVALMLDALRARPADGQPLPGHPLTVKHFNSYEDACDAPRENSPEPSGS